MNQWMPCEAKTPGNFRGSSRKPQEPESQFFVFFPSILLMEEILHQLISSLSHYLQGFIHPRWCRISSINSISLILTLHLVYYIGSFIRIHGRLSLGKPCICTKNTLAFVTESGQIKRTHQTLKSRKHNKNQMKQSKHYIYIIHHIWHLYETMK